jgi:hypothetical protein
MNTFRSTFRAAAASVLLTTAALAQTTGVAGINDFTINGSTPGSASCTNMCFPTPVNLNLDVSTVNGNFVIYLFSFCPCVPCVWPWGTNSCSPSIPMTACGSTTNQSFDLLLAATCGTQIIGTGIAVGGVASMTFSVPAMTGLPCTNLRTGLQAVVLDWCGVGSAGTALNGPFVLTQGYSVDF